MLFEGEDIRNSHPHAVILLIYALSPVAGGVDIGLS